MIRHAGSIWGLVEGYQKENDPNGLKRRKIEKALDYLTRYIQKKEDTVSYLLNETKNSISLGGNGLAVVAICEYTEKFHDTKYLDFAKHLANGILDMQEETGKFVNLLSPKDYSVQDVEGKHYKYYCGEATLALGKLYGITKDSNYLEAAKKSLQYFVDTNYAIHSDHWTSYAANEITKYVDDESFYELGLRNVANNMNNMLRKKATSHTDLEMLMQCFELYDRILERNLTVSYLQTFPVDTFKTLIQNRVEKQFNSYLYPEIAMYLTNPSGYCDTFFIRTDGFRIRIDDIQHSIVGYSYYVKHLEKIKTLQ